MLNKIIELRHVLHQYPEVSMKEHRTKQRLMDFLKSETNLTVVDRGKWFYAFYDCGNPKAKTIGFRADYDALPIQEISDLPYASVNQGVFHGCGHDGHSAALAGFALTIAHEGADKNIVFIFQHAEEIGGGGEACAELIAELGISEIYAFHNMSGFPEGSVAVREGVTQCASKGLTVSFQGETAHASQPEDGRNPAKAIAELTLLIDTINTGHMYKGLMMATVVDISVGSKNFGIAASEGEVSVTLRAYYEEDMRSAEQMIKDKASELAKRDGLKVYWTESDVFPETVNDAACVKNVMNAAKELGLQVIEMDKPIRASEDFGYYLKQCSGCMFYVGNGENYPPIHTLGYDFNDRVMQLVILLFKNLVC